MDSNSLETADQQGLRLLPALPGIEHTHVSTATDGTEDDRLSETMMEGHQDFRKE